MNASRIKNFILLVASLSAVATGFADTLKLNGNAYSNYQHGTPDLGGGSYTATVLSGSISNSSYAAASVLSAGTFETFCLEFQEHFSPGATYNYSLNNIAYSGDVASGGDPISVGTAWLYSRFATGTLAANGYNYSLGSGRVVSNTQLQLAFWYLEDETQFISGYGAYDPTTNAFLVAAFAAAGGQAAAKANAAAGLYGVQVLNLTSGTTSITQNQSQLYYHVPEHGLTLAMFGSVIIGLACLRKRGSRSN